MMYDTEDVAKGVVKVLYIIVFLLFVIFFIKTCSADVVRNVQDNYLFTYTVTNPSGDFVSGQTITLSIKKVSNGYWYDFSDNTFKASGWTSKTTTLLEDSTNGYYYYLFDPPDSETSPDQYLFVINNDDSTYGDHQVELVVYQDIGTSDLTEDSHIGIDWSNIANPDATVSLPNTEVKLSDSAIDDIWDENLSTHTTNNTAGKKLSGLPESGVLFGYNYVIDSATSTTVVCSTFTTYADDFFVGYYLVITSGDAENEVKEVIDFDGSTGTFTVYPAFATTPNANDTFELWKGKPTIVLPGRN